MASWIELQTQALSAPTVKQHLAAIRHLFDWLVAGQIVPHNPAASVRGPSHTAKKGKTTVLDAIEARQLLDSIDVTTPAGLRDRALIALMVFSFARVGAALAMRVDDVYVQHRRLWVRPREKDGERHEMPCHRTLEAYQHAYLDGTGIGGDPKGPLFCTIARGTGQLSTTPLPQANAYAMVRRRASAAGIGTAIGNHTFRATGITTYLKTAARSRTPRRWPITRRRAPRSSMTGAATTSVWTSSSGSVFSFSEPSIFGFATCFHSGRLWSPVNLPVNAGFDCDRAQAPEERMPVGWSNEIWPTAGSPYRHDGTRQTGRPRTNLQFSDDFLLFRTYLLAKIAGQRNYNQINPLFSNMSNSKAWHITSSSD